METSMPKTDRQRSLFWCEWDGTLGRKSFRSRNPKASSSKCAGLSTVIWMRKEAVGYLA